LIVGIDEDGDARATAVAAATLATWAPSIEAVETRAAEMLRSLSILLPQQPRIRCIDHAAGRVLLVGVARAPSLVPCVEASETLYYMRIHRSTVHLPEIVAADLLTGRRQRPSIELGFRRGASDVGPNHFRLHLDLLVRNVGLIWLADFRVGGIALAHHDHLPPPQEIEVTPQLRSAITSSLGVPLQHGLQGGNRTSGPLPPFGTQDVRVHWPLIQRMAGEHNVALYVAPLGHPPVWFRLGFAVDPIGAVTCTMPPEEVRGERPVVAFVRRDG
jgi:hypothetical protein